ncbi:VCBS repeat-containing protein [Paenibacillus zeisoli]|uniref:VCBS repeat-containing protein n=1 Tax=Paenibacillus zeisoli TaxID=2496267 RepID=A0A3S1BTV6_9BACL|nr:VCBS repeat-containing protein [Paenibacillus zeisoli]RUT33227.1 VCBS repeat-containing protein [Paenibacillus zeisoli]
MMNYFSGSHVRPEGTEQVLDREIGDVTGDRVPDTVTLTGQTSAAGSPFITGITLVVHSWGDRRTYRVPLRNNAGYQPTLFLGDFTGDSVSDVLVRIDSGGSGAITFDYVYTFTGGQPKLLFDSEQYNQQWNYTVNYLDFYRLQVNSPHSGKSFTVDISSRGKEYLDQIYNPDGTLKKPVQGFVDPLSGLYPIDLERDGTYELMALQGVSGLYHADRFGYMTNLLKWNGGSWELTQQWFSFLG